MNRLFKMLVCMILCLAVCLPITAITGFENENLSGTHSFTNPVFYSSAPENEINVAAEEPIIYHDSYEDFVSALRDKMVKRETTVVIGFKSNSKLADTFFADIYNRLFVHTGNSAEGDYLLYHFNSYNASYTGKIENSVYYYTFTYNIVYHSTTEQEDIVTREVDTIVKNIKASAKTEYETVKAIYDYICKSVKYDYTNLNDPAYFTKFTAYAALVDKTSVCQGYSNLFYRIALECGLDARIVIGVGNGEAHAWNIVKLGDKYYNLDATWDAPYGELNKNYHYFLKCDTDFSDHKRAAEFTSKEFCDKYPIDLCYSVSVSSSKNHKYSEDVWYIDCYATADHTGEKSHHCEICGERLDVTEIFNVDSAKIYKNYTEKSWSKDSIDFVSANGLMGDTGNGSFAQTGTMTRSMFVTVLWRIAGKPTPTGENIFTDLDPNQTWYHDAVIWANENGIVKGTSATTFSPNGEVTREQIATLLYRYDQNFLKHNIDVKDDVLDAYPDQGDVSSYANEGLAWANTIGLIKGQTGAGGVSVLAPKNNATREEVAIIISRFCLH